jgi:hypothetical protein
MAVASVDDHLSSVEIARYIAGLGQWVNDYISPKHGFEPYMVTFMFRLATLKRGLKDQQMREEISRVYSRFLTECVRNPWSQRNRDNRPILIACQDWPVWKKKKKERLVLLPWEGAHWGSILLVPPWHRLKTGLKNHFETSKRTAYIRPGLPLSRIHVEHIDYQPRLATDYVMKSIERRRCSIDDILILPFSQSERPARLYAGERT